MKKIVSAALSLTLLAAMMTGCSGQKVATATPTPAPAESTAPAQPSAAPAAGTAVKTGLSLVAGVSKSKDATAEKEGTAQSDIALVAVTVGDDGVIDACVIDAIQAKIGFSAEGKITTDLTTEFASKNELGDGYGMRKASSISKEWNEQAAAFCEYVTGKTVSEVSGIAVNEKGAPSDADLAASVTLGIGEFQTLIEKAAR